MPDPMKTEKMKQFPMPTCDESTLIVLGLASYYWHFVPGFLSIAAPFAWLNKRKCLISVDTPVSSSVWSFERVVTAPVLVYPKSKPEEEFVLQTDASLNGLGAVLGQWQDDSHVQPIVYASRNLQPHETNYAITELGNPCIGLGCKDVQTIYPVSYSQITQHVLHCWMLLIP